MRPCVCASRRWCSISATRQNITVGLQGKFSVYHGAAIGLVRGKAGLQEYTDDAVNDPTSSASASVTTAVGDESVTEDQAHIEVELTDGRVVRRSSRRRSATWRGR